MRRLVSSLFAVVVIVAAAIITIGYAELVGLPFALPFGELTSPTLPASPGSPSQAASSPGTAPSAASPSPGPIAVLVGAGDIAMCDRFEDESTAAAVERIPGTVFTLGDNVYPDGSAKSFKDCYEPSWGRPTIKSRTRPTVGGNEYRVPDARDYFAYFGDAAGDPGKGYYAYEEGSWRVYVLNSNCHQIGGCGEGSAQEVWLRDDLKRHSSRCVLAMWHHPLFSSRPGGGIGLTRALWRALEDAGAELVLNGDVHSYERFRPQTADGVADDERGMVEIVVGTGGAESGSFGPPADNSVRRAVSVYGVLRLELARSSYRFEFLSTGGRDFSDSGSRRCS